MRRTISIVVVLVLVVLVGATVVVAVRGDSSSPRVVRGVIPPDVQGYFDDPQVVDALRRAGVPVRVDVVPSPAVAAHAQPPADFVVAPNAAVAATVRAEHGGAGVEHGGAGVTQPLAATQPFGTPIVVAATPAAAQALSRRGLAHEHDGMWTLDLGHLVAAAAANPSAGSMPVIAASDIATSNSAALYAAAVAAAARAGTMPPTPRAVDGVLNAVSPLFVAPGRTDASFDGEFARFRAGHAPGGAVVLTEAQFLAQAVGHPGTIPAGTVLLYPDPGVLAAFTVVPLTAAGATVARLVGSDPGLQELAVGHGFRTGSSPSALVRYATLHHVPVASSLPRTLAAPNDATLESLVSKLDDVLHRVFGDRPAAGRAPVTQPSTGPAPTAGHEQSGNP